MPGTLIKWRLNSNKHKPKIKQEKVMPKLPPNVQSFKQKLLSGRGFFDYN